MKVVLKIVTTNVNIAMDPKMLIRKLYLKLEILIKEECRHVLVSFFYSQPSMHYGSLIYLCLYCCLFFCRTNRNRIDIDMYMLTDSSSLNGK